ncbi:MAG: histidine--tRNA ligase [Candidatus Thermoplasmatota archaeon]|nr:histidine--tRNA ligase [Candidatus Thermoplasmatota archaeon]
MQRPRGTRDFLPSEMRRRRLAENKLREVAESYGYGEIATPTFEEEELFIIRSGEGIVQELYNFEDKGGRRIALRPELTAPVMRAYVADMQFEPKPIKLYYVGNAFRYERPQSGRYREFWQFGAEVIGADTAVATAECIAMAVEMARSIACNVVLKVGHIGILRSMLRETGMDEEEQKKVLRLVDKGEVQDLEETLLGRLDKEKSQDLLSVVRNASSPGDIMNKLVQYPQARECFQKLQDVMELLSIMGVENAETDLAVVRGLDYYTGIVFEIEAPELGAEKQVCGGGEYRLAHLFGGTDVATVGFAIGFDRILLASDGADSGDLLPVLDYYIISIGDTMRECAALAKALRSRGKKVDMDLMGRNLRKAMKYASSRNAKTAVIVGERDAAEGKCTFHDMATGEDEVRSMDDVLSGG